MCKNRLPISHLSPTNDWRSKTSHLVLGDAAEDVQVVFPAAFAKRVKDATDRDEAETDDILQEVEQEHRRRMGRWSRDVFQLIDQDMFWAVLRVSRKAFQVANYIMQMSNKCNSHKSGKLAQERLRRGGIVSACNWTGR